MKAVIRTFSHHCRERYGQTVGKLPVDIGLVCPNRRKGGCIFCRPASFTPTSLLVEDDIAVQVKKAKEVHIKGRFTKYFVYFQQETCTAAPTGRLLGVFASQLDSDLCVGLILSTRPDAVDEELLEGLAVLLGKTGKDCLFEFGLQSIHDKSLFLLNRNHSYADFTEAVHRVQQYTCFEVGAHLIFGIPGESEEEMLQTVETVCSLGLDALKLHHLQVIRGTALEKMFREQGFELFSLDSYLELLVKVLVIIPENVTLHRLWATSHPELLVAPKWNVLTSELSMRLRQMMRDNDMHQGKNVLDF